MRIPHLGNCEIWSHGDICSVKQGPGERSGSLPPKGWGTGDGRSLILNCNYNKHLELLNINLHNVTHPLTSQNPRERMSIVQISILLVTFLSLIS
jgi:hypothetical protein